MDRIYRNIIRTKENGCDALDEELAAFAATFEADPDTKALSLEEPENVAGGKCDDYDHCNHRGKGGWEHGFKKDYKNNYRYQENQCGYGRFFSVTTFLTWLRKSLRQESPGGHLWPDSLEIP